MEGYNSAFDPAQSGETDLMIDPHGPAGHPALTDQQTGLPNRLHFDTVFEVVFSTGSRGVPVAILLLEIDRFPEWVAKRDAAEANRILRALGDAFLQLVRRSDLFARTDESRFALCLVDCNLAGAMLVAHRVSDFLASFRPAAGLGFCMGGAAFDDDMQRPGELIGAAENALRVAQGKGTNQMEFHR